jgi:uncharacterized protein YqeY
VDPGTELNLPQQLQADLLVARKARDDAAVTALRTTLAAFANAEAPPVPPGSSPLGETGLNEHDRLALSADDHHLILRDQIATRTQAIDEYEAIGQVDAAEVLRAELAVLEAYL